MAKDEYVPFTGKLDAAPQFEPFDGTLDGEKPKRTWGEAIKDTGAQLAEGVNTTLGAIPSVVAPQSKAAGFFRDNAQYWRDQQSDVLKDRIAASDQRIQEAGKDGVLSQIGTAASEYWNDPAQAARLVATNLPSMAATLGTGAAAGLAAKGVAAARGLDAANKAALAAKYGTTTTAATNAALNAGGARGEAFEDLQKTALAQGMTPEQAEQAGVSGSILPGVVGGVAGAVSGKIGLEKALLGQATTGAAMRKAGGAFGAELAGEQIEELAPKVATNYQVGQLDAARGLTDDLGRTMVETAIGSGPGAVVAGGAAGMRTGELPPVDLGPVDPTTSPGAADPNAPVPPPVAGPTLALPAPERGVIHVGPDGTARTPAYQAPGYVGDVTDVEPRAVNPVREQVAAAAEQGGALSSAALTAIDTGLSDAMQPAPEQAPPQISLEEADARDQAAYEQFFANHDSDPVVGRYLENDDDIPDFDAASNASEEDFLRALGATDEDIQDAIATSSQSAIPQSSVASNAGPQAYEPAGPREGAGEGAASQTGQVNAGAIQQAAPDAPVPGVGGPVGADGAGSAAAAVFGASGPGGAGTGAATGSGAGATEVGSSRAGGRGDSNQALSAPTNLRDALERVRQQKQEAANAQVAQAPAPAAAPVPGPAAATIVEAAGVKPAGQQQLSADEQAAQDREEARAKEPSLPPALSARLQEAHKAHGRDVKRSVVERGIANEKANNTGTPKAKRERADRIARLEADLALFDEASAMPPKEAAGPASIPATIGANSEPTPPQAIQAGTQPAQAAAAPAAGPAPTNTAAPAPAGAPEVRALSNGAPTANTGAQAAPAAGAQAAPKGSVERDRNGYAQVKLHGKKHFVTPYDEHFVIRDKQGAVVRAPNRQPLRFQSESDAIGYANELSGLQAQSTPTPPPGAQAAPTAEDKAQRVARTGEAWTRMPTVEREAMAGRADGLNPMQRKNVPRAAWADLSADIQRKLADAMNGRAEIGMNKAPAAATQQAAPVAEQAAPKPDSTVRLGRNNAPLNEGGKPFKTRKAAGDAKKLQPTMRVVTVPGGYALAEKTPAQLAAEERASRRLRNPNTSARGEPIPAHAFIAAAGGLNRAAASDMGVDGNPRIGNRTLFAGQGRGLSMDQATQMLIQDGYLSEGATINDALALIKKSLTRPQYNADGIERIAQAESDAQFEDYLAAQEEAAADGDTDPFGMADEFTSEELDEVGYTAADPALQAEVSALIAQAEAMDIDTYAILEDIARTYANATQDQYNAAARDALAQAIVRGNQDGGSTAAQAAPASESSAEQGLNQPEALGQQAPAATENVAPAVSTTVDMPPTRQQESSPFARFATGRYRIAIRDEGNGPYAEVVAIQRGSGVEVEMRMPGEALDHPAFSKLNARAQALFETPTAGMFDAEPPALELAAQTPAEAAAQQEAQEQAAKAEAARQRAADAQAARDEERKRIAQASVRAADSFELGQDPLDSLTGQGSIFDAPEQATEDNYLDALFGGDSESASAAQAAPSKRRIDAKKIVPALRQLAGQKRAEADDWMGRVYRSNTAQIDLRGDGPSRQDSMSTNSVNESRRRRAVEALTQQANAASKLADRVENGTIDLQPRLDSISDTVDSDMRRDGGKPMIGASRADMFEGYISNNLLGDDNYGHGKGTVARMLREAYEVAEQATPEDLAEQAAQPITRADVTAAQQQAAAIITERIDAMTAGEVNTIARRFLPTMGVRPTVSKERNKAAVADFTKVNPLAAAEEFGAALPADVRRVLQADMEGRVADAGQDDGVNPRVPRENRAPAKAPTQVEQKEPWQMTALEFSQQPSGNPHWNKSYAGKDDGAYLADTAATHALLVRDAVAAGKLPESAKAESNAGAAQPDTPKLTPAEAKSLMVWEDMGQKDGVKTHALTFYESQADKDAKRGRMIVAKVSKGDRSATAWVVDGEDKTFGMLAHAKKLAEEVGMARAVADGYVEQGDPMFSFAGQQAATADQHALATAQQRLEVGEDAETVRQETGWFQGNDGKWRFEISDADARLKDRTQWTAKIDGINAKRDAALQALWQAKEQRNDFLRARGESPSRISSETKKTPEFKALAKALKNAEAAAEKAQDAAFLARQGDSLITVGDVLSHPALFAAYPGIADVRVDINDSLPAGNAAYAYELRAIELSGKSDAQQLLSTLLHEIQHGIQHIEGFAMGGSIESARAMQADAQSNAFNQAQGAWYESRKRWPSAYKSLMDQRMLDGRLYDKYDIKTMDEDGNQRKAIVLAFELRKKISEADKALRSQAQLAYNDAVESELGGFGSDAFNEFNGLYSAVTKAFEGTAETATSVYKRLAGEVEARNTQARQKLTADQRRVTSPGSTADVADADVIVVFNGKEMESAPEPANAEQHLADAEQRLGAPLDKIRADSNARNVATQMLVDGLKAKWTRAPEIIVARNMQDPQVPQAVRDYDAELKSQGSDGEARGFIYKGKVYLLSDQLKGPQQIAEVLFHEVLGHYGLRGAFGESLTPILQQIGTMRRRDVVAKAREYGLFDKDALGGLDKKAASDAQIWAAMSAKDRLSAAEEVLAEMAQTQPTIGFVQRAIAAIRNWLRSNVPGFKILRLTDADIVQAYILPARGFVTRSKETGAQSLRRAMAAFSRDTNGAVTNQNDVVGNQGGRSADDTTPGDLLRKLEGTQVVDPNGAPLLVYHGSKSQIDRFDASKTIDGGLHFGSKSQASMRSSKILHPAYLYAKNLRRSKDTGSNWKAKIASAKAAGYDGIVYLNRYEGVSKETVFRLHSQGLSEKLDRMSDAEFRRAVPEAEDSYIVFDAKQVIQQNESSAPDSGGAAFSRTPGDKTQTEAFKRWFAGSRVVDAEGKPLVVYHGSSRDIESFAAGADEAGQSNGNRTGAWGSYFTPSAAEASIYAEIAGGDSPQNVVPVYLAIRNPYVMNRSEWGKHSQRTAKAATSAEGRADAKAVRAGIEALGHDGIVIRDRGFNDEWVAFRPEQIKSSTGNRGTFDPANPDIRFSRTSTATGTQSAWDAPVQTGFDDVIYKLQDKNIDLKRVVESITKSAGQVADSVNAYLKEELFHKRAAKRVEDFGARELKPLMNQMRLMGLGMEDVEEYLHARHAKEANAVITQRNPGNAGLQDGGSGMTNAAADNYFAKLDPTQRRKLEAVAKSVDAIIEGTRKLYVDYGLEDQAVVDGWANMYQHYIPLMREDKEGGMGTGQGFSVKGKETKGRTGSTRKVVDILANIASQREKLIVRGEKNQVTQALIGLARANPNSDFWEVRSQAPTERVFDPKKGIVVDRPDPLFKSRDNVVVAKVQDSKGNVTEQMVVFNEDNPRAVRMAAAMKNLDAGNLEGLLGMSAKITRYFSAINTQYNPVFGVVNLVRDVQGAMVNLAATPLAGQQGKIAKDTVSALRGIYSDIRKTRRGGQATSQWAALWEQMQDDGGTTGYRELFTTSADRANNLKSILNPEAWMDNKWGKFFTANGQLKVPMSIAQKGATEIFGWLSDYNEAMENGVRLAAYKAALDKGMSREQAASLAKNLTVNFNRKGQVGMQAGAVYAFFNAAMQGTARIGQTLFDMDGGDISTLRLSKTGKAVVYGGVTLGVMQALALAGAGFDEEDPPEFVRERSLIIPTGGKTYVSIPMPLGLHVIPGIGRHATEFALSGFDKPAKRALSVIGMFADAFNPIGNAGLSMQTLAPTALDPLVALTENKDWTGKPIARVSSNKAMPGHTQWKDTATGFSKVAAEAINWISGGNEYVAGAFSPTPDQIDYLLAQVGGGVAREAAKVQQTISTAMSGETLPTHKIPLVGRFVGNAASQASQGSAFYANLNKLNALETEIKGLRKDGRFDEAAKLVRENPQATMIAMANRAERDVQKLRRDKRELIAKDASREEVRAKEDQITAVMMRLNEAAERRKAN